jgi:hypothetical protein
MNEGHSIDCGSWTLAAPMYRLLEIKQYMHECQKLDLFDLDMKLMTSVGPVYKQQETSSHYCVANDNLCNVCRYCKLLMLQHRLHVSQDY